MDRLGGILRPLGDILGPHGRIIVPLGPSWRHLGGLLALENPPEALTSGAVAETQRPLQDYPEGFRMYISLVYPEEKEV